MDGQRFDRLTRRLAGHASRRAVVRSVLRCAGGGLLSATILRRADATSCGGFCSALPPGRQRGDCAKACAQDAPGGLFATCEGDATRLCQAPSGAFVCCALGQTCCGGACVLLQADPAHCGACGAACGEEETCCSGVCVNILTDPAHCSGCDEACAEEHACCGGVCIDTQRDEANCGTCGTTCHPHATCFDGACRCCQGGTVECGPFSSDQICCDFPLTAVKCCNALCDDPELDCVVFCIDCGIGLACDYPAFCPPGYGVHSGAGGPVPGACIG